MAVRGQPQGSAGAKASLREGGEEVGKSVQTPLVKRLAVKERQEGASRSRKGCFQDRRGCWPERRRLETSR